MTALYGINHRINYSLVVNLHVYTSIEMFSNIDLVQFIMNACSFIRDMQAVRRKVKKCKIRVRHVVLESLVNNAPKMQN